MIDTRTDDASLLRACGEALYGEQWQRPLARTLDVDDRGIRRMAAGLRPVPRWYWTRISGLLDDWLDQVDDAIEVAERLAHETGRRGELPSPPNSRYA